MSAACYLVVPAAWRGVARTLTVAGPRVGCCCTVLAMMTPSGGEADVPVNINVLLMETLTFLVMLTP